MPRWQGDSPHPGREGSQRARAPSRPPDALPRARAQEGRVGPGTLFVVSTPIGNLEDVTLRALRVLREADVVACEDTRVTRVLLGRHGILTRTVCYNERNHERTAEGLLARLGRGERIALVTDAGTPGISDPAGRLIALAVERGLPVVPVPGASAILAALVVSALPAARFVFEGFLPKSGSARRERLARIVAETRAVVIYESPIRTPATLRDLAALAPARRGVVGREITKLHEEFLRGTLAELAERYAAGPPRGEVVLLVEGREAGPGAPAGFEADPGTAAADPLDAVRALVAGGLPPSAAVARAAREHRVPRRELYRRYLREIKEIDEG